MKKIRAICIQNNLSQFSSIINSLISNAPFHIESSVIEEFSQPDYLKKLEQVPEKFLFILIENNTYCQQKKELRSNLNNLSPNKIFKVIRILDLTKHYSEKDYHIKFCVSLDPALQSNFCISYMISLFHKLILEKRLTNYITDSFGGAIFTELLNQKNKEIKDLNNELETKNKIDSLTHLYNRNAVFHFINTERERTIRNIAKIKNKQNNSKNNPDFFSILLIDVDHFKQVNDCHGHLVGDKVLRALGKFILSSKIFKKNDFPGRFGGEEFLVVLPDARSIDAALPASRLCQKFKKIDFYNTDNKIFHVTLSIGISENYESDKTTDNIIMRADKALYHAKESGRDQVVVYEKTFIESSFHL